MSLHLLQSGTTTDWSLQYFTDILLSVFVRCVVFEDMWNYAVAYIFIYINTAFRLTKIIGTLELALKPKKKKKNNFIIY